MLIPAFVALIKGIIILAGTTRLSRIPIRLNTLTLTPAAIDDIHKPNGTNIKNNINNTNTIPPVTNKPTIIITPFHTYFYIK